MNVLINLWGKPFTMYSLHYIIKSYKFICWLYLNKAENEEELQKKKTENNHQNVYRGLPWWRSG